MATEIEKCKREILNQLREDGGCVPSGRLITKIHEWGYLTTVWKPALQELGNAGLIEKCGADNSGFRSV